MRGATLPLPPYAFMTWCLVKNSEGELYIYFYLNSKYRVLKRIFGPWSNAGEYCKV
jgi:hypothetical protein